MRFLRSPRVHARGVVTCNSMFLPLEIMTEQGEIHRGQDKSV